MFLPKIEHLFFELLQYGFGGSTLSVSATFSLQPWLNNIFNSVADLVN